MDEATCFASGCGAPRPPRKGRSGIRPMYCDDHAAWRKPAEPRPEKCAKDGCDRQPRDRTAVSGPWPTRCTEHDPHWRKQFAEQTCAGCGASFQPRLARHRFCSRRCGEVARGDVRAEPLSPRVCAVEECDVEFVPQLVRQRCCCERHGKLLYNRESRADGRQVSTQVWDDRRRDAYHRRRALKKAAATGAPVVFAEIAQRDRWKCGLCGKRVLRSKPWPHPLSPSLDHIVPLTRGGTHDPSNVQLAHLRCNSSKGNRGGGEQLMLIG